MKRLFGKKKGQQSGDMALNITSMADIFTIILVFLLKSYATASVDINPSKDLKLPTADGGDGFVEAVKLEISETAILIEGNPVTSLKGYAFSGQDKGTDGLSQSLGKALGLTRKRQEVISKVNDAVKNDSKIIVIADQRVPYSTLKTVLASAATHGFTDYKLAVIKRGD